MQDQEVKELLQLIDKEQGVSITRENIFDGPVRLYLVLKTMYQNYKKDHELQIMQARIFEINLKRNPEQQILPIKVSAASLFEYHNLNEEELQNLISMKDYLKQNTKQELYSQILKGIDKQRVVGEYMRCYRSLLNKEFMNQDLETYRQIQNRMISKLLSQKLIRSRQLKIVTNNLLALPILGQPILVLISKLYQLVENIKDFKLLFLIFIKNFPQKPEKTDIQALLRISLPETLAKMNYYYENDAGLRLIIFEAAESQAKHKLQSMEITLTSKTSYILSFIIQVVKLGIPIWQEIIQWQHKASQQLKNMLKNDLEGILVAMLKDFRCFETVIAIIEKITDIEQHSEIGLIFVRELLKLQSKQYLSNRIIRKFLAIKILKYNSSEQYVQQIFGKNLRFIEVILQIFNYKGSFGNFYQHILNNESHLQLFEAYLNQLAEKLPLKLKQFFLKCTIADSEKNQLFGQANSVMLKIMAEKMSIEVASNYVRDLGQYCPSKGLIYILSKLLAVFKQNKQIGVLKNNMVRALNMALIRTPKHLISKTFQIQFPAFIKGHLMEQSGGIFTDVSEQTKEQLKKTYDFYVNRKKM